MISELSFSHFRGYGVCNTLKFALPIDGRIGLTVLVGKNGSGKSTILGLLSEALDEKPSMRFDKLDRHPNFDPQVKIEFKHDESTYELTLSKSASAHFNKKILSIKGDSHSSIPGVARAGEPYIAFVPSRRPWNDTFNAEAKSNLRQFDSGAKRSRNPNQLADLGNQLNSLIASEDKEQFDKLLKQVIPEIDDWSTDGIAGQDRIVYKAKSGAEHAISDSGDGIISLFRICHAICKYPPRTPLLLDEPELSLHPEAQRKLYNLIIEVARHRQVIVSTHSPHFVEWRHIADGVKVCRVAQDDSGISRIHAPEEGTFQKVIRFTDRDPRNRKLYDYLAKEMFFQSGIVFLEGQEDVHLLSSFIENKGEEMLPLFSYGAGGSGNILHLLRLAKELGLRAVGVYDGNKANEFHEAEHEFTLRTHKNA